MLNGVRPLCLPPPAAETSALSDTTVAEVLPQVPDGGSATGQPKCQPSVNGSVSTSPGLSHGKERDANAVRDDLIRYAAEHLGHGEGVLVLDDNLSALRSD